MTELRQYTGLVLTRDAHQIHYRLYRRGHSRVIIISHGFFTSKQSALIHRLAEELTSGFDVLTFDYRGHGESDGVFYWTAREYRDLEAVIARAQEQYAVIGVLGFSLGAATAIISLSRQHGVVRSLACVSAPTQMNKIDYNFWDLDISVDVLYNLVGEGRVGKGVRPGPFWLRKHRPVALAQHLRVPVLYVHGMADWVIKPWHSRRLFEQTRSAQKRIELIQKGPHAEYLFKTHKRELMNALLPWFDTTLR